MISNDIHYLVNVVVQLERGRLSLYVFALGGNRALPLIMHPSRFHNREHTYITYPAGSGACMRVYVRTRARLARFCQPDRFVRVRYLCAFC